MGLREHLESELLDPFILSLRDGCVVAQWGTRVRGRMKRLSLARDFLLAHVDEPIRLENLCEEIGMSRRGLELMFRDLLGVGPITYQRIHGVHCVRRESGPLLQVLPGGGSRPEEGLLTIDARSTGQGSRSGAMAVASTR